MPRRHKKYKLSEHKIQVLIGLVAFTLLIGYAFQTSNLTLLNPKGIIALKERNLIITIILLMLAVVIPVFGLTAYIAWNYRDGNKKAKYAPGHNSKFEAMWWAIPSVVVLVLAVITWKSTHELDPFKQIKSDKKPITIQVVALQWKWLFIYPEQNIATVNFIQFPAQTPVNFELTADAPMNSFWIPQLGGQMYAMAGMSTSLHLMASAPGDFAGSAAEISGRGFAGMRFLARASTQANFDAWVQSVKKSPNTIDLASYNKLSEPSENNQMTYFSSATNDLYHQVMMKFMPSQTAHSHATSGVKISIPPTLPPLPRLRQTP
jgi:cytochrome o ubiquinol oxidase subunit 2